MAEGDLDALTSPYGGRLIPGDCREGMASLDKGSVDLIFADPPYNLSGRGLRWKGKEMGGDWYMINEGWDRMESGDYLAFTRDWLTQAARVLGPRGSLYVCCTLHNIGPLMMCLEGLGLKALNIITWYKTNAMPSMTRRTYTHACEYLLYFAKGPGYTFNYEVVKALNPERRKDGQPKQMRDLWVFPVCQGKERVKGEDGRALHPTQKPLALVERAILASSQPGDLILDPFMGSGTTAVAAHLNGRRWVGVEANPRYREATLARLEGLEIP